MVMRKQYLTRKSAGKYFSVTEHRRRTGGGSGGGKSGRCRKLVEGRPEGILFKKGGLGVMRMNGGGTREKKRLLRRILGEYSTGQLKGIAFL